MPADLKAKLMELRQKAKKLIGDLKTKFCNREIDVDRFVFAVHMRVHKLPERKKEKLKKLIDAIIAAIPTKAEDCLGKLLYILRVELKDPKKVQQAVMERIMCNPIKKVFGDLKKLARKYC